MRRGEAGQLGPGRDDHAAASGTGQQRADGRLIGRVVQHQLDSAIREPAAPSRRGRFRIARRVVPDSRLRQQFRRHRRRPPRRTGLVTESDEETPAGEVVGEPVRGSQRQRGLADAYGAGEHARRRVLRSGRLQQLRQDLPSTGEVGGVRGETVRGRSVRGVPGWFTDVGDDLPVHRLEHGARRQAQLTRQLLTHFVVYRHRLPSAARAVQRGHLRGAQALAQRVLFRQFGERIGDAARPTRREGGLGPVLADAQVTRRQPLDQGSKDRRSVEFGERRAGPQPAGLVEQPDGPLGVAVGRGLTPGPGQGLEAERVQLRRVHGDPVAAGTQREPVCRARRGQRLAQIRDVGLEVLPGRARWFVIPDSFGQHIDGDGSVGLAQQNREDHALLERTQGQRAVGRVDGHGSEDGEPQLCGWLGHG